MKRIKNGNSFLGYTETSWNTRKQNISNQQYSSKCNIIKSESINLVSIETFFYNTITGFILVLKTCYALCVT